MCAASKTCKSRKCLLAATISLVSAIILVYNVRSTFQTTGTRIVEATETGQVEASGTRQVEASGTHQVEATETRQVEATGTRQVESTGTLSALPESVSCHPQTRIAFAKVHKAGSTTVMNILQRFGIRHNLTFVLASRDNDNYLSHHGTVIRKTLLPAPPKGSYDILCNHVVYNRNAFRDLMPSNTMYIGIVRQPFNRFLSAAVYNRYKVPLGYLKKIPGGDNYVNNLIMNYSVYEPKDPEDSVTNNRMSVDFGFPPSKFNKPIAFMKYLEELNTDFELMLIMEYMAESLVLLKRLFCWTTQDIIFITRNAMEKYPNIKLSAPIVELHKKSDSLDYLLYDFFLKHFWRKIRQQGDSFINEVNRYKEILQLVKIHCNSTLSSKSFEIKEGMWNNKVQVQGEDCKMMLMEEIPFVFLLQKRHKSILANKH